MDGFRLVKLNEVIRQVDIVITCTGTDQPPFLSIKIFYIEAFYYKYYIQVKPLRNPI